MAVSDQDSWIIRACVSSVYLYCIDWVHGRVLLGSRCQHRGYRGMSASWGGLPEMVDVLLCRQRPLPPYSGAGKSWEGEIHS